jgi:LPXTG-motif cell wall-anchored protein
MTNKFKKVLSVLLLLVLQFVFIPVPQAHAATAPDLGAANSYSVFGNAGITETAGQNSHLWGNVGDNGLGHASLIASQVDGTLYDVSQPTVVSAISAAYGALAAQGQTGAIDLAGSPTVGPGVYDVAATAFNSTLTLSGDGVYIFRSTSSIAQTAGGTMLLTNGATSCNVYWQIPTSMTFAAAGSIVGTIITNTGLISFTSGVNLVGRAFAATQVTMDNNQITQPVCATTTTSSGSSSGSLAAYCEPFESVAPIIIESRRIDADSVFISWGPYSGINTFIVEYGTENGKWLYNTRVTGFSTTLNNLPANRPIWVRVTATDYCSMGVLGEPKLVGGPGLPNTGLAASQRSVGILAGAFVGLSALLVLVQRKQIFSSRH